MPGIERCTTPEQLPPLEPLSELNSLHDSSSVAPPFARTPPPFVPPVPPKRGHDVEQYIKYLKAPLKLTLVLENKGNVARDHLASERTYLAYVRTSLATSSAGVALVQLFALAPRDGTINLAKFGKPLGATLILFGLLILILGVFRYFMTQSALVRGFFPVARHSITAVAFVLGSLIGILFGILIAGAR